MQISLLLLFELSTMRELRVEHLLLSQSGQGNRLASAPWSVCAIQQGTHMVELMAVTVGISPDEFLRLFVRGAIPVLYGEGVHGSSFRSGWSFVVVLLVRVELVDLATNHRLEVSKRLAHVVPLDSLVLDSVREYQSFPLTKISRWFMFLDRFSQSFEVAVIGL